MSKKFLSLIICFSTFLFVFPQIGLAENINQGTKVVYKQDEIKDTDKLFERAKNNITDVKSEMENRFVNQGNFINSRTGEKKDVKLYKTTQKLETKEFSNGETENSYATTVFAAAYTGSRTDSATDVSVSVRAYSTIYWTDLTVNGYACVQHKGAAGGWTIYDSNIAISNRKVQLAAIGWSPYNVVSNQIYTYDIYDNTFNLPPLSNWTPISVAKKGNFGANSVCTVRDIGNGDTWSFKFNNYLP